MAAVGTVRVAVAQMLMRGCAKDLTDNVVRHIATASERRVKLLVLPECAVTGYANNVLDTTSSVDISFAESRIAEACHRYSVV
jgi:predicted amidohydrolase